jgi:hypothetical protein
MLDYLGRELKPGQKLIFATTVGSHRGRLAKCELLEVDIPDEVYKYSPNKLLVKLEGGRKQLLPYRADKFFILEEGDYERAGVEL